MFGNGSESFCFYVLMTNGISERKIKQFLSRNAGFGEVKFAVNLTQKALNGEFDKLIGRDREIERLIQVLHKKRSSCACLVGNPGTGKTAVIEGLAQRIANGNVPPTLENTGVWALDMGAIVAGTKLRGEFEERLKQTIESVLKNKNVILFIDELHMISGAGATSDGSMDAGNILKPYLTRNDFKCVGATTYEEYKKHIQKDKALARRFKKIDVLEPSKSETLKILQGIRSAYECFHGIKYPDNILELIVDLSEKYLLSVDGELYSDARLSLAMLECRVFGNTRSAAEHAMEAYRKGELGNDGLAILGEVLMKDGKYEEFSQLPEIASARNGRLALMRAKCLVKLNRTDEAESILNDDLIVPDIREGEISISDVWCELYARKIAKDEGRCLCDVSKDEVFARHPLPYSLDFRMH